MSEQRQINRRSLLKASATGLAAASTILAGCSQGHQEPFQGSARRGRVSPNERVTLGFIGTGDLGRRHHMGVLLGHEGIKERVDIAAVCDVDANRVSEAARMCMERANRRVGVYEDYRRLLDRNDLDAVFVVTPDHWHTLVALAAIEAGKDIAVASKEILEHWSISGRSAGRLGHLARLVSYQRIADGKRVYEVAGSFLSEPPTAGLRSDPGTLLLAYSW